MTKPDPEILPNQPLDALLSAAVDAIILCDSQGLVLRFNPAAQRLFGYTEEWILGRNVSTLMPEPDRGRHDSYLNRYLGGGEPAIIGMGREVTGLHVSGRTMPMHLSVGEIQGIGQARFVGIIRDLSDEKATQDVVHELETHLAHADRLVILGELTAGIAHEINQPLTAIAAFADAGAKLLDSGQPEAREELQAICQRVAQQARRAGDVVNRLRGLSRKGDFSRTSQDLELLLNNVLLLLEHELKQSGITLSTDCEPGLPTMMVDEIQIQQVLVNLVKNSIDSLKAAGSPNPEVAVSITRNSNSVDLLVRDNGPGVPVQLIPRLFEPFLTTKPRGVGLGLSICKNIAISHGGNLVYETPGQTGAQFRLSLPLSYIG
jgi:two-component system sensor kinase FixL